MNKYLLLCLLVAMISCQSGDSGSQTPPPEAQDTLPPPVKPEMTEGNLSEDDLMMRLSANLVADPQSQAQMDENAIIDYAIENKLDVYRTNSGLYYQIILPGEGEQLRWGDRVRAHYRGYTLDGKEFDNSYKRARPLTFYVGNMIQGFNEGLQLLKPRGKAKFIIPSGLGYGEAGIQLGEDDYLIQPNKNLVFEVEVLEKLEKE